jgi:PKD repeat protein
MRIATTTLLLLFLSFNSLLSSAQYVKTTATDSLTSNICDIDIAFEYSVDELKVQFTNVSGGNYNDVLWDFGDNTRSSKSNPIHIYEKTGIYDFCLTLNNSCIKKCERKFCGKVYIFHPCD